MNRVIKFREYVKADRQMFGPWTLADMMDGTYVKTIDGDLMQFTGLLDKNGKEIYEGDILSSPEKYGRSVSIVKWDNEGAYFHVFRGDTASGYTMYAEAGWSEVIGNIYENPELTNPPVDN